MKTLIQRASVSAMVFAATALPALAGGHHRSGHHHHGGGGYDKVQVPEIDASTGLLALAAVLAAVAFAWEIRRRRALG
jgi:hypothetical protein